MANLFRAGGVLVVAGLLTAYVGRGARPAELYEMTSHRSAVMMRQQQLQMLKYKENLPDDNPFENFDAGYQAPPYTTGLADQNVFEKEGDDDKAKPYKENVAEESVLDDMPDDYPFNELKGGHTWHEWKGESVMEALGESNALDDGTTKSESYELGEHSLGRPFKEFKPAKNVYDGLDDEPHKWGVTDKSIPEKNILDGLSPDTGYGAEESTGKSTK